MVESKFLHQDYSGVTTPALIGICFGGSVFLTMLAAVVCVCYRRRGFNSPFAFGPSTRLADAQASSAFNKRPTAVRSPSGGPGPLLRKSPSSSGAKSPPGSTNNQPVSKTRSTGGSRPSDKEKKEEVTEDEKRTMVSFHRENEQENISTTTTTTTATTNSQEEEGKKCMMSLLEAPPPDAYTTIATSNQAKNSSNNKLGQLHFRLLYQSAKNALVVTIERCTQLPAKDSNSGSSDPYVKLQLLPDKQHKVKTRVLRKTLCPVYDEDFTFYGISGNQLQGLLLHFVVLSFDRYSRDDVIGEVLCPLATVQQLDAVNMCDNLPIAVSKPITPRNLKVRSQGRGELLVSLCHQPAANRLTVVVLKARNLPKMDITGLSDPYVKIYLLYNNQRIAKKKTHVKKRTLNPVFNESFVFDVPSNEGLGNISMEFLVLDWDRVTKNEVIGRLELGARVSNNNHHWREVCGSPRRQIAEWHKLRE